MRDRGVGHQTHDVVLSDGSQAAPQDRGHGEAADPPLQAGRSQREQAQAQGDHAEGSDLVENANEEHRGARASILRGIGKPGVKRDHGGLNREGNEEGQEETDLNAHGKVHCPRSQRIEAEEGISSASSQRPDGNEAAEHHQTTGQREEKELHRSTLTCLLFTDSVTTNHDEERNEHSFESQVEEQDIGSRKDQHHEGLKKQHPSEISSSFCLVFIVVPTGQHDQGNQGDGKKNHNRTQCIHGQRPTQAHLGNPRVGLGKLIGGGRRPIEGADKCHDGRGKFTHRQDQGEGTSGATQGGDHREHQGTQRGKRDKNRQPRKWRAGHLRNLHNSYFLTA